MIIYLSGLQDSYFDFVKTFQGFGVLASFAYLKEYQKYLDSKFGEAINKASIAELNYLLCNSNVGFNKSTNIELF